MTDKFHRSEYAILVTRKDGEYTASIPELCVAEKAVDPSTALAAALKAEAAVLRNYATRQLPQPPPQEHMDPFPAVTRFGKKHIGFVTRVIVGYALVLCVTAVGLALIYPAARSRAEQYLASKDVAVHAGKAMSKLGIVACSESR